ncbi:MULTISPECIES: DUF1254 domain-containing protein [unclassified Streptomyces]|uniref:DUF1254 domain-containing protein n=1 Tax=unclassified Streptomyces TaxID=2593676 RepID=UPI003406454A
MHTSPASPPDVRPHHTRQHARTLAPDAVPGPLPGTLMSDAYLAAVGRVAYLWGWPLVNLHNRLRAMAQLPAPALLGGVVPGGPPGTIGMLYDYVQPQQRIVACANQDVVYGFGMLDAEAGPCVVQVADLGDRFWVIQLVDQRTESFGRLGSPYGSKPGHYLLAPHDWDGEVPPGIEEVFRYDTRIGVVVPRMFMDDTAEDRAALLPGVRRISVYPLAEYDGSLREVDWTALPAVGPIVSSDSSAGRGEQIQVDPDTFFDQLAAVMDEVPPLPGEESLYALFRSLLTAAGADPAAARTLREAARSADAELVADLAHFRHVGLPAAHGWTTQRNGARFGTDYLTRTAIAKSNIFVNPVEETLYYYLDVAADGSRLHGGGDAYTVTFGPGALPPVRGFWSLTLYDAYHFFHPNDIGRYSLGTKNQGLHLDADGSLTITVAASRPTDPRRAANWLPAPEGEFSLFLRAYWPDDAALDGTWTPPAVLKG